jgi:hypothetical protein
MKAQRRHELQQNVLDAELARGIEFVRQRRTYIIWGVVLATLAILAVTYVIRSTHNKERSLQTRYDQLISSPAVTPQQFVDGMKSLAESSSGRLAGLATIQVGKFYAAQFSAVGGEADDPRQRALRDQAAAYFQRGLERFSSYPLVVAEAHLGLGRLAEGTGDFATAAKEYKLIAQVPGLAGTPQPIEAALALDRLDRIKTPVRMATTTSAPAKGK